MFSLNRTLFHVNTGENDRYLRLTEIYFYISASYEVGKSLLIRMGRVGRAKRRLWSQLGFAMENAILLGIQHLKVRGILPEENKGACMYAKYLDIGIRYRQLLKRWQKSWWTTLSTRVQMHLWPCDVTKWLILYSECVVFWATVLHTGRVTQPSTPAWLPNPFFFFSHLEGSRL